MEDGYWNLFWSTGRPEFYLRARRAPQGETGAGTAVQPLEADG